MTDPTPLDLAHAAMEAAPEDDAARLRFYERLADGEVFLLLAGAPEGENVEPELFDVADARFVLVFDREERLARFHRPDLALCRALGTGDCRHAGRSGHRTGGQPRGGAVADPDPARSGRLAGRDPVGRPRRGRGAARRDHRAARPA